MQVSHSDDFTMANFQSNNFLESLQGKTLEPSSNYTSLLNSEELRITYVKVHHFFSHADCLDFRRGEPTKHCTLHE